MTVFHIDNQRDRKSGEVSGVYVNLLTDLYLPLEPGRKRMRVHHQKLMIEPGTEDQYHYHKKTWEIFTIESGRVEALIDGRIISRKKGDVFLAKPLVSHRLANRTAKAVIITETRLNVEPRNRHLVKQNSCTRNRRKWTK